MQRFVSIGYLFVYQTQCFQCSTQFFVLSLKYKRSSNEQGCARSGHCNMYLVFSGAGSHSHVVTLLWLILQSLQNVQSLENSFEHLMRTTQSDVVAIQESKITPASRAPKIPYYTAIRTDREHKQGGGLITYIKSDTTFTHIKTPQTIHTDNTEIQLLKIHTKHFKDITIANIYIAPETPQHDTTTRHHRHYRYRHNKLHTIHHQLT